MKSGSMYSDVILGVIRGELPLSVLSEVGVHVVFGDQTCQVSIELPIIINPSASDIARGFLTYKAKPSELARWASFLLGASQIVGLESLELQPQGDLLISALWDASFEGRINKEAVKIAESLV